MEKRIDEKEQPESSTGDWSKNRTISFADKLAKFSDHWSPKVIAEMNDYQIKVVKIQGDFVMHNHIDTDEVFIVLEVRSNMSTILSKPTVF